LHGLIEVLPTLVGLCGGRQYDHQCAEQCERSSAARKFKRMVSSSHPPRRLAADGWLHWVHLDLDGHYTDPDAGSTCWLLLNPSLCCGLGG
jgi:hypothetical protein